VSVQGKDDFPSQQQDEELGAHVNSVRAASKETRSIVTPFAFGINDHVLGLPLASPLRRGIAILVDSMLVALTAKLSFALVSLVASAAIFTASSSKFLPLKKRWIRYVIRTLAVFGFIITALIGIAELADSASDEFTSNSGITPTQLTALREYRDTTNPSEGNCDAECIRRALIEGKTAAPSVFSDTYDTMSHDELMAQHLVFSSLDRFMPEEVVETTPITINRDDGIDMATSTSPNEASQPEAGLISWGKAILSDLGIGFGWAAVYFSVFPVLWRGQTPGKKLMNIRVLALNGNYMNLWDAFGRYGGYGAGFATGLLGFLQIYWDPNRQAIHDKISSTVVIKGSPEESNFDTESH